MKRQEIIRKAREATGLSASDIEEHLGISVHEYRDIEAYDNELVDVVELATTIKLCEILKVDIFSLFDLSIYDGANGVVTTTSFHEFIKAKRMEKKLTIPQLATVLGFEEEVLSDLEKDGNNILKWPFGYLRELCQQLSIPVELALSFIAS